MNLGCALGQTSPYATKFKPEYPTSSWSLYFEHQINKGPCWVIGKFVLSIIINSPKTVNV